jgi:hypothetical protein
LSPSKNLLNQPHHPLILNPPGQPEPENRMVDTGEILGHITFQHIAKSAGKKGGSLYRRMSAFSRSTGIGIKQKSFFKDRLDDATEGMMDDTVTKRSGANQPWLLIADHELTIGPRVIRAGDQGCAQRMQFRLQIQDKRGDIGPTPFPPHGHLGGFEQIGKGHKAIILLSHEQSLRPACPIPQVAVPTGPVLL